MRTIVRVLLAVAFVAAIPLGCGDPKREAPKADAAKAKASSAEASKAEVPTAEAPKVEIPKADAPTVQDARAQWRLAGRAEAESDLAAGKLRLRTFGLPAVWAPRYSVLARKQLGLEFQAVAGCVVDDEIVDRTAGYNQVMRREIDRRYGPRALDKVAEQAQSEFFKN